MIDKESLDNIEKLLLVALHEKNHGTDVLIQPWMDGFLIHIYDQYGNHINTVGASTLYDTIQKL